MKNFFIKTLSNLHSLIITTNNSCDGIEYVYSDDLPNIPNQSLEDLYHIFSDYAKTTEILYTDDEGLAYVIIDDTLYYLSDFIKI